MDKLKEKLYYAIQANDVTGLRWLIRDGVNVDSVFSGPQDITVGRPERWFSLHLCCQKGHYDCAKELLESGADPNVYDRWNQTPLFYAIQTQWSNLVQLLLNHGADPNVRDRKGKTPIHICIQSVDYMYGDSQSETIKMLVAAGANPDLGDALGRTPLWLAAHEDGHVDHMLALLEMKVCDVNAQDVREKRNPLQAAIMHASKDRITYIQHLLKAGSDVNSRDARNHTAFMNVMWKTWSEDKEEISEEDLTICKLIIEAAIMHASKDRITYIQHLLKAGSDVNSRDARNHTAFMNVMWKTWSEDKEEISEEDLTICKLIIESGYNVNDVAEKKTWIEYGGPTLSMAVERGTRPLVDLLLENGANPDITDNRGACPLLLAALFNRTSIAARLIHTNPSLDLIGQIKITGQWQPLTPFQCACLQDFFDIARMLVLTGSNLRTERYLWSNENVPVNLVLNCDFWLWLKEMVENPISLLDQCRREVRRILGRKVEKTVPKLPIPGFIKSLVLYEDVLGPWLGDMPKLERN